MNRISTKVDRIKGRREMGMHLDPSLNNRGSFIFISTGMIGNQITDASFLVGGGGGWVGRNIQEVFLTQ